MELIVIITIVTLYSLFALSKDSIKKFVPFKVCSICYAVSITWVGLYLADLISLLEVDSSLIGILMGGSIVGIMYSLEKHFVANDLQKFWLVRIVWFSLGTLLAYYLLTQNWDYTLLIVILLILFSTASLIFSKPKEEGKDEKHNSAIANLSKKLEKCCD